MTESDVKKIQKRLYALEHENEILRQEIENFKKKTGLKEPRPVPVTITVIYRHHTFFGTTYGYR